METKKDYLECYLPGCMLPAMKSERCFAYCSTEHKGKAVGKEVRNIPNKRLSIKEMQTIIRRRAKEDAKKNSQKPKNERTYI